MHQLQALVTNELLTYLETTPLFISCYPYKLAYTCANLCIFKATETTTVITIRKEKEWSKFLCSVNHTCKVLLHQQLSSEFMILLKASHHTVRIWSKDLISEATQRNVVFLKTGSSHTLYSNDTRGPKLLGSFNRTNDKNLIQTPLLRQFLEWMQTTMTLLNVNPRTSQPFQREIVIFQRKRMASGHSSNPDTTISCPPTQWIWSYFTTDHQSDIRSSIATWRRLGKHTTVLSLYVGDPFINE